MSSTKIEINLPDFEGTPDKIATQLFQSVVLPILQKLNEEDQESAKILAFSMMWLGMSQYAQFFPTDGAEKSINFTVDKFMNALKQQRGESKEVS